MIRKLKNCWKIFKEKIILLKNIKYKNHKYKKKSNFIKKNQKSLLIKINHSKKPKMILIEKMIYLKIINLNIKKLKIKMIN